MLRACLLGMMKLTLVGVLLGAAPAPQVLRMVLGASGREATVLLYQRSGAVTVLVRFTDPNRTPERFHFGVNTGREDAVCRLPVHLEVERIAAYAGTPRGRGFALVDGACDSIHFYWNPKTHRVDWWRL